MPEHSPRHIRKIQTAAVADFDDQLWPINCAILILAGFVAGIVIAASDFSDPRILYNGWVHLAAVVLMVGILFWAVIWLQGKVVRRIQLCVLFSLLIHLWLAMYLHEQFLALMAEREARATQQLAEIPELETLPEYHWQQIEQPRTQEAFEKPVETEAPKATEPEPVEREPIEAEVPVERPKPVEPEAPRQEQPNPAEIRRAEVSAPRRAAEAAGAQISRQEWKHRPEPDEPIPQPEVRPPGRETPSTLRPQVAAIQRRQTRVPAHQREAFELPPSVVEPKETVQLARRSTESVPLPETPATPTPTRQRIRPSAIAQTEAEAPEPVQSVREPQPVGPTARSTVAPRQVAAPRPVRAASEPTPVAPREATPALTRQDSTDQRPELAQAPETAPSRAARPQQISAVAEAVAPAPRPVAPAQPAEAQPRASGLSRQVAMLPSPRAVTRLGQTVATGVPTTVAPSQARRAGQSGDPAIVAQPESPSPIGRQAIAASALANLPIEGPAAPQAAGTPGPQALTAQPRSTALARASDVSAQSPGRQAAGRVLPALTSRAQLPSALARRAPAASQAPAGRQALSARPSTLAQDRGGVSLPSTARATEAPASPAATGGGPPSRIDASSTASAVQRSATEAPTGPTAAGAGAAEFAVGSAQVVARAGQPRASGSGQPSVAPNGSVQRIARASTGAPIPTTPGPEVASVPSVAAASGGGGLPSPSAQAQATSVGRAGSAGIPTAASTPRVGAGPAGSAGASGLVGTEQMARLSGRETMPSVQAGGGTPRPSRAFGRGFSADALAQGPETLVAAPSGGRAKGPKLEAEVSGQQRQISGLPGSLRGQPETGAVAALTSAGAPLPTASARRATPSQQQGGGTGPSPAVTATLARADSGINLPAAATPVENVAAAGAAGLGTSQGGLPSSLDVEPNITIQRTDSALARGRGMTAAGSAELALGASTLLAAAGQVRAGNDRDLPTLDVGTSGSQIGRQEVATPGLSGAVATGGPEASPEATTGGPSDPAESGDGLPQLAAEDAGTAASRGVDGLPTPGPRQAGAPTPGTLGDRVVAAGISRAGSRQTELAQATGGGISGPVRSTQRMPGAELIADVAPAASGPTPAAGQGNPGEGTQVALNAGATAQPRQVAGLPGDLLSRVPVDANAIAGPASTTPGTVAGRRRLPQGDEPGPSIAAEVGGGPLRTTVAPGLPRGLAETSQPMPSMISTAAEPGEFDVPAGSDVGGPSRREGGLPVQIAALPGPGGLSDEPSPVVGIPSRHARPESEIIHPISRRFVVQRSGGLLAIDGRARELPTEGFGQRDPRRRSQAGRTYGITEGTERAVEVGLDFFARHQFPDGHWSLDALPGGDAPEYKDAALGQMNSDTAATGLALLGYLGAGYTHLDDKHRAVVRRGLDWLLANQQPNGQMFTEATDKTRFARIYAHGIATIALCEAYGMTRDPDLREAAQKAVQFIYDAQDSVQGGWRYTPAKDAESVREESDTSVSGWQLMALKSAQMAGLEVSPEVLQKVGQWLDFAQADGGARYVYNPHTKLVTTTTAEGYIPNLPMTAEGLLMRMYLGWDRNHPAMIKGTDYLKENLPEVGTLDNSSRDCYYWYYATQVMFQMQGEHWTAWNDRLHPLLESSQVDTGPLAGSWHPDRPVRDRWAHAGGRHYVTALNVLMLEVYYRHLPLYQTLTE